MFTVLQTDPVKAERIKQEVQMFLQKQAIQVVADKSSPGYYSRVFLVQKKNGKWRCIIDLSQLNLMVQLSRFKMETVASLRNAVQPGDFAGSVDLQDVPDTQVFTKVPEVCSRGNSVRTPVFRSASAAVIKSSRW